MFVCVFNFLKEGENKNCQTLQGDACLLILLFRSSMLIAILKFMHLISIVGFFCSFCVS